jgi:type III pantothenate kinase
MFLGYVAMIEGMTVRIKQAMIDTGLTEGRDVLVLATGGFAPLFKQHTDAIDLIVPELTLDGLRVIYERSLSSR